MNNMPVKRGRAVTLRDFKPYIMLILAQDFRRTDYSSLTCFIILELVALLREFHSVC